MSFIKNTFLVIFVIGMANTSVASTCKEMLSKTITSSKNIFRGTKENTKVQFLGYRFITKIGHDSPINYDFDSDGEREYKVTIYDGNNNEVGKLYAVASFLDGPAVYRQSGYFSIELPTELKRQGLGRAFMTQFISQNRIKSISTVLYRDNYQAFAIAIGEGMSDKEAYSTTPSGKVYLSLGFDVTFVEADYKLMEVSVRLER